MTKVEIGWLAGLFEGEGSFYVNTIRKNGKTYKYPAAAIKMTDRDVVEKAYQLFGKGNIRHTRKQRPKWKPTWTWTLNGFELTNELFQLIKEHLGERRLQTANIVLSSSGAKQTQ